jgi:hypothetical protein
MIYGLIAEFQAPHDLIAAVRAARRAGYSAIDAYTPFPVEGLDDALGMKPTRLPKVVFAAGLVGLIAAYLMQLWMTAIDYPLNVGGRPNHSWPSFMPVMFEVTILFAVLFAVVGMLAANGLPQPFHPLFALPRFELATQSHFFLCIEARDPKFELARTREFLAGLKPTAIDEVPK